MSSGNWPNKEQTLTMPFFFSLAFMARPGSGDSAPTLSMVASVVASVSGLMTGGLHFFLRSNSVSTIGPKGKTGDCARQRIRGRIRRWGTPDGGHVMQPMGGVVGLRRILSGASWMSSSYDKEEATLVSRGVSSRGSPTYDVPPRAPNALRPNAVYTPEAAGPVKAPQPAQMPSASKLVPEPQKPLTVLQAIIYTPGSANNGFDLSTLKPPPCLRNLTSGK